MNSPCCASRRPTDDYGITEPHDSQRQRCCPRRGDEPRTNNGCIPGNENASRETAHAAPERDPARDPFRTRKVAAEYGVRIFLLLLGDRHSAAGSFQMRIVRTGCCGRVDRDGPFLSCLAGCRGARGSVAACGDPGSWAPLFSF